MIRRVLNSCHLHGVRPQRVGEIANNIPGRSFAVPPNFTPFELSVTVTGERADKVLKDMLVYPDTNENVSLAQLHKWARGGHVRVYNPETAKNIRGSDCLSHRLSDGDQIIYHKAVLETAKVASLRDRVKPAGVERSKSHEHVPKWIEPSIKWFNKDFITISKPAGISTQGGTSVRPRSTVDYWLPHIEAAVLGGVTTNKCNLRLVHRLDRDVSGLLLLARSAEAAEHAREAFATREGLTKVYVAFVPAHFPPARPLRGVFKTFTDDAARKPLETTYEVMKLRTKAGDAAHASLLFLEPITGRKHQLRQHAKELFDNKVAIFGDTKYAPQPAKARESGPVYLHALGQRIAIADTKQTVWDELPEYFQAKLRDSGVSKETIHDYASKFLKRIGDK